MIFLSLWKSSIVLGQGMYNWGPCLETVGIVEFCRFWINGPTNWWLREGNSNYPWLGKILDMLGSFDQSYI